jgi:hypothetical protein
MGREHDHDNECLLAVASGSRLVVSPARRPLSSLPALSLSSPETINPQSAIRSHNKPTPMHKGVAASAAPLRRVLLGEEEGV